MIKIDFDNARINSEDLENVSRDLGSYLETLRSVQVQGDYSQRESSVNLPFDNDLRDQVRSLASQKGEGVRHVIVVGIGGSSLGAETVFRGLGGHHGSLGVDMVFVETVDSRQLKGVEDTISSLGHSREVLLCVISKSGQTTETAANADIIYRSLFSRFGEEAKERVVVISDRASALFDLAEREGFSRLSIPEKVGGRYSVFSAVGLFPLAVAGVDIDSLSRGAADMINGTLHGENKSAVFAAVTLAHHYRQGVRIHDLFIFDPALESLGKWYRQLLGESIGKTKGAELGGERVGITPTVSIGSTDLHSVGQLYFGGPKGAQFTTFIRRGGVDGQHIPGGGAFSELVPDLGNKSSDGVLEALALGAEEAYINAEMPFVDVFFENLDEYNLGLFMQWKMLEIMFLAELLEVNPFDQPAVESYKENVRRLLSS